jgi:hypothetical protein
MPEAAQRVPSTAPPAPWPSKAAFTLGILAAGLGWMGRVGLAVAVGGGVAAILLGTLGLHLARDDPQAVGGRRLAYAGLALGAGAALGWSLLYLLLGALIASANN